MQKVSGGFEDDRREDDQGFTYRGEKKPRDNKLLI